jgi:hypothetical protein
MLKKLAAGLMILSSLAPIPAFAQSTTTTPPAVSPSEPGQTALGDKGPALGSQRHHRRHHTSTKPVDAAPDGNALDRAEAGGGGR